MEVLLEQLRIRQNKLVLAKNRRFHQERARQQLINTIQLNLENNKS